MSGMPGAEQPFAYERALSELGKSVSDLRGQLTTTLEALELIHDDDPTARRRLAELRGGVDYDAAFTVADPLVSIVIPTWDRVETLIGRSVPSALAQTHANLEVIAFETRQIGQGRRDLIQIRPVIYPPDDLTDGVGETGWRSRQAMAQVGSQHDRGAFQGLEHCPIR